MHEMLHIFITLNPIFFLTERKREKVSNLFELMPIEAKHLNYLLSEDVCCTTIPAYQNLSVKKIRSKLFS